MKIILRQNIESLGAIGDVVEVKAGYARNYLFPRNVAYPATESAVRALNEERRQDERRQSRAKTIAEQRAEKMGKLAITIPMKVGEDERFYGAVTAQMIADAVKQQDVEIDRRTIELDEPIKTLGIYDVPVKLHPQVTAILKVWVVAQS